jgi:hypothetical protein
MPRPNEIRVLGRAGARELSKVEAESVQGGLFVHTNVCSINPLTGARDGDACPQ